MVFHNTESTARPDGTEITPSGNIPVRLEQKTAVYAAILGEQGYPITLEFALAYATGRNTASPAQLITNEVWLGSGNIDADQITELSMQNNGDATAVGSMVFAFSEDNVRQKTAIKINSEAIIFCSKATVQGEPRTKIIAENARGTQLLPGVYSCGGE